MTKKQPKIQWFVPKRKYTHENKQFTFHVFRIFATKYSKIEPKCFRKFKMVPEFQVKMYVFARIIRHKFIFLATQYEKPNQNRRRRLIIVTHHLICCPRSLFKKYQTKKRVPSCHHYYCTRPATPHPTHHHAAQTVTDTPSTREVMSDSAAGASSGAGAGRRRKSARARRPPTLFDVAKPAAQSLKKAKTEAMLQKERAQKQRDEAARKVVLPSPSDPSAFVRAAQKPQGVCLTCFVYQIVW